MSNIEYSFDGTVLFVFPRMRDALDLQSKFIEFEDCDLDDCVAKFNKSGQCVLILNAKITKEVNDRYISNNLERIILPYSLVQKTKFYQNKNDWIHKPMIYLISNIAIDSMTSINNQFQAVSDETGNFRISKISKSGVFETFYTGNESFKKSYSKEFIIQQILQT